MECETPLVITYFAQQQPLGYDKIYLLMLFAKENAESNVVCGTFPSNHQSKCRKFAPLRLRNMFFFTYPIFSTANFSFLRSFPYYIENWKSYTTDFLMNRTVILVSGKECLMNSNLVIN